MIGLAPPGGPAGRPVPRRAPRRHRDRLRRHAARARAAAPGTRSPALVLTGDGRADARRPRRRSPRSSPVRRCDVARTCPTAGCPPTGTRSRTRSRTSAAELPPDLVLRAADRRRPPGPPAGRLARSDGVARRAWSCTTRSRSGTATSRSPTHYVAAHRGAARRKVELLNAGFPSPARAATGGTTRCSSGLMRLRGMECRARYAEGFFASKVLLGPRRRERRR